MAPRKKRRGADGDADGADMEAELRPKKRGRRPKNEVPQESQPEPSEIQQSEAQPSEAQPSKRGRRLPPAAETGNESTERASESIQPEEKKIKRRGRPKREGQQAKAPEPEAEEADDENENEGENEGNSSLLRRSRRSRRLSDKSSPSQEASPEGGEDVGSSTQQAKKRRKRPNQPINQAEPSPQAENGAGDEPASGVRKRKRGKMPLSKETQPLENDGNLDSISTQKKGRQSKSGRSDPGPSTGPQDESSQRQGEPENDESQVKKRRGRPGATHQKPKGRRRSSEEQEQSPSRSPSPDSDAPLPYRHIAKHTRRVTHEVIESKWSSLDPSSVANVANILHSVSLPTLLHVVPKQYAHAEDVLERVIRGLRKRSAMLPFPPASTLPRREDELDFERTQSAVEALTSQLDPLQHSVELLRREKERAEKQLEREYKVLDRLSTNARAEARERKDRLRKVHVLVPEAATYDSAMDSLDLLPADKATGHVFAGAQDADILDVAKQINNHMESMRGNIQQINGVLPAIAESHALLKTALQPQFSQKQLEHIVLG